MNFRISSFLFNDIRVYLHATCWVLRQQGTEAIPFLGINHKELIRDGENVSFVSEVTTIHLKVESMCH